MKNFLILGLTLTINLCFSQSNVNFWVKSQYSTSSISVFKSKFQNKNSLKEKRVKSFLNSGGVRIVVDNFNNSFSQIEDVTFDGYPLYNSIFNYDAGVSTRTNPVQAILGLNLQGQNMSLGVWDGGRALGSHIEFYTSSSNTVSRVINGDGSVLNSNSFHATHVTGTVLARGADFDAKGMAPRAQVRSFDWNDDELEVINEATNGMLISNHSYGVPMYDGSNNFQVPDWYPGNYSSDAVAWDDIAFNFPYYLMVVSAGNEGNKVNPNAMVLGYDKLNGNKVSKNNLVVANAQDANIDPFTNQLISVAINSSSSVGPSDDFRIKPDITGNGTNVYSTGDGSNTEYITLTGTSMAAPNVAGSILLLQQHYFQLYAEAMRAATLKGIVCLTADDAGTVGPDPIFGWGLLNTLEAANLITEIGTGGVIVEERVLNNLGQYSFTVNLNSTQNIKAAISWTDIVGASMDGNLNDATPVLVSDLDLRIIKDGVDTFFPWKLNPLDLTTPLKGDNLVDNIEIIEIDNALPGSYEIIISHKGNLISPQNYSLIFEGNDFTLNTEGFSFEDNLSVFPNPTFDVLNIISKYSTIEDYELFDLQGRIIEKNRVNGFDASINLRNYPKGIYILKVNSDNGTFSQKIIKR